MVHNKQKFIISGFVISDPDCISFLGKNELGILLMRLRTELRNTFTTSPYTSSLTTQPTRRRSASVGRLNTPRVIDEQGLKAKFEQNNDFKQKPFKTRRSEIIERSTHDQYWSQLANETGL